MPYKFDATKFDVSGETVIISFDLVDTTTTPTVVASTSVSINVPGSSTALQARAQIASDCKAQLQAFYDDWKMRTTKITTWLSNNEAALEAYLENNIAW